MCHLETEQKSNAWCRATGKSLLSCNVTSNGGVGGVRDLLTLW